MKNSKLALGVSVLGLAAFLSPARGHADIMGTAYFATQGQAQSATIGATAGLPVEATFTVPQPNSGCTGAFTGDTLCFSSFGKGMLTGNNQAAYTLGDYLSTGGATVTSGPASLGNTLSVVGTSGTMFEFIGSVSVTTGQVLTAIHDDGMSLLIGTTSVINSQSATTTTATYNGPTGNFPFDLVYAECCGGAADMAISLPPVLSLGAPPPSVPEPASLAILGSGLIGLGAVWRRRKSV